MIKAERYIASQMQEVRRTLKDFFVKHDGVREVKKGNDRSYYKAKDRRRVELIKEEHAYRQKRDEKEVEQMETQHKADVEWEDKMRQYYEQ